MRRVGRVLVCFGLMFFLARGRVRATGLFHQGATSAHHLAYKHRYFLYQKRIKLTHARTPPINPKLYPVAKSSLRPLPIGLSGRLIDSTRDR